MKRAIWLVMAMLLILSAAACGGGPAGGPAAEQEPAAELPAAQTVNDFELADQLSIYNWEDYIDPQVLADYEEQYGVEIIYDTFASNEDMLAKLQAGATGYDIIFPSDYIVAQMIAWELLAEIDVSKMPNWANIGEAFKNPEYDPGNRHCIPYTWGMTGLAYRLGYPAFEEAPASWAYLFDPEKLEQIAPDGINVLNDQRELISAALFYLGYSPNTTDRAELEAARDVILAAKPYWKTFNSEDYHSTLMAGDEVVLSHAWSGDAAQIFWSTYDEATGTGNWIFTVPVEGAVRYQDNVCISSASQRVETAQHFMNYLMDAEVAAAITNFTFYPSPNEAAKEFINPDILNNPGIYPPPEVQAKMHWLKDPGDAIFIYDEIWTAIKGQ